MPSRSNSGWNWSSAKNRPRRVDTQRELIRQLRVFAGLDPQPVTAIGHLGRIIHDVQQHRLSPEALAIDQDPIELPGAVCRFHVELLRRVVDPQYAIPQLAGKFLQPSAGESRLAARPRTHLVAGRMV